MTGRTVFSDHQKPRLRRQFARFALCAAWLAPMSAAGLWAQGQLNGVVTGRVTDSRGQPQRLFVRLLAEGDIPAGEVYTDSNGLFVFSALPSGTFYIQVQAEGYRTFRQSVRLDERVEPKAYVSVILEPLQKGKEAPGLMIGGSAATYKLNAKKMTRPFDPKALQQFDKGNEQQWEGRVQSAIAHYRKALRIEPDFYPALNNLGALLERQGDRIQAEAAFLEALKINPDDGEAYINLGHLLFEEGKYQPAIERIEQGLKRAPESAVGHFFLGSSLMKLGDLRRAEPNLKTASALDPAGMARAHLQLANLYLRQRDLAAASNELESYLQANPSDPQAPAIKKMLADLKARQTN